jgi:hypothetical protein
MRRATRWCTEVGSGCRLASNIPPPPPGFTLDASGDVPPPPPGFTLDSAKKTASKPVSTFGEDLKGELESTAHFLTGGAAALGGGLTYVGTLAATRDPEAAKAVKEETERKLTYEPKSQAGKEITANLERPFQKLAQGADVAGRKVAEVTGSPALGAAANTVIQSAPAALAPEFARRGVGVARAAGEAALERARPAAERIATAGEEKAAVRAAEEAPKQTKIQQARSIGLKLPPSEAGGPVGKVLEGAGGKVQTEMSLSRDNAKVINRTAAKDIGLSERQPMTEGNIERLKQKAFKDYDAVKKAGKVTFDDQYREDLGKVRERTRQAEEDFPDDTNELIDKEIKKFDRPEADTSSALEKIKSLRDRASRNMKSPDAEKFELGLAQKKIATAMENQIERQFSATNPDLIKNFRASRQQLAKIYNVEDALSPNGNVSAAVLARIYKRNPKLLTGGLKTIAETYQEFPKVMRYVDNLGGHAPFSALDYLVGGVEAAAHPAGAAKVVGALAGRPLARGIIKSEAYQSRAIKPREVKPSVVSRAARQIAGKKRMRSVNGEWVPANTVRDLPEQSRPNRLDDFQ